MKNGTEPRFAKDDVIEQLERLPDKLKSQVYEFHLAHDDEFPTIGVDMVDQIADRFLEIDEVINRPENVGIDLDDRANGRFFGSYAKEFAARLTLSEYVFFWACAINHWLFFTNHYDNKEA